MDTGAAATQRVCVAALALLSIILSGCATVPSNAGAGRGFTRNFAWQYGGRSFNLAFDLHPDNYERFRKRQRTREYDLFASDFHSKPFIREITRKLADYGTASGLSNHEIPYFIVSFVQNLPYTSDDLTTGFDEYPRFPYETLYDNGGDCEDTSILAAAIPPRTALRCRTAALSGAHGRRLRVPAGDRTTHYRHHGRRYCYLETTGDDWDVGVVPPSVRGVAATIKPIIERPVLLVEFVAKYRQISVDTTAVDVTALVTNLGSHTARGATMYVALRKPGTDLVWDQIQSDRFGLAPEETFTYEVAGLQVKPVNPFQVYVQARGTNFAPQEAVSEVLR